MGIVSQYKEEFRYVELAVNKYSDMLFRICYGILLNEADTEDVLQETFIRYMTKAPLFKDSEHEKAWLIKVATNLSKNVIRFRNNHSSFTLDKIDGVEFSDDDIEIFESIMKLPSKYKTVLDLYYIEGYKANEIASLLSLSPVAVRKRLQYGRKLLKIELERNELL